MIGTSEKYQATGENTMIAIRTKIIPWTSTRPDRVKAWTHTKHSVIMSKYQIIEKFPVTITDPNDPTKTKTVENAHMSIAIALCKKLGWTGTIVEGVIGEDERVFCFLQSNKIEV